jgi:Ohr subfamily peroxiredoxin
VVRAPIATAERVASPKLEHDVQLGDPARVLEVGAQQALDALRAVDARNPQDQTAPVKHADPFPERNFQLPESPHRVRSSSTSRFEGRPHLSSAGEVASAEQFEAVPPHPLAERLFAGAWSACYSGALALTAAQMKIKLPADLAVGIEVDLGQVRNAVLLQARLNVRAPGMDQGVAEQLAHGAHEICPYSKATRGNIGIVRVVTA